MYKPIHIAHRLTQFSPVPAVQIDEMIIADHLFVRNDGLRRYFWLTDFGVQLVYEPFGWKKEWYVDFVSFAFGSTEGKTTVRVMDEFLDVVVEGMGPTYRLIDLDELADSLDGSTGFEDVRRIMRSSQRFLDSFLHRGSPWPPPDIKPWFSADHAYPPLPSG